MCNKEWFMAQLENHHNKSSSNSLSYEETKYRTDNIYFTILQQYFLQQTYSAKVVWLATIVYDFKHSWMVAEHYMLFFIDILQLLYDEYQRYIKEISLYECRQWLAVMNVCFWYSFINIMIKSRQASARRHYRSGIRNIMMKWKNFRIIYQHCQVHNQYICVPLMGALYGPPNRHKQAKQK